MAGDALCSAADKVIPQLGDLLKYGSIGLALAVVLVLFGSLLVLQRQANVAGRPEDAMAPMERLMKRGMGVIILLFLTSVIGAPMVDRFVTSPASKYLVSFSVDPSEIDGDDLLPRLVVSGSGSAIQLKDGTGQDTVDGMRSYSFKVGRLVKEVQRLNRLLMSQQLEFSKEAKNEHD